jgi:hypothetical protein
MRRDHKKYLALIDAVALLHQYQREVKEAVAPSGEVIEYIEVELRDVEIANRVCHEILGRSLDELAPQTRRLLVAIDSLVTEAGAKRAEVRFTRKQVREYCGWSLFQVQKHMQRLVAHEYVIPHRGARGSSFVYELMYDGSGADGKPSLLGLIDPKALGGDEPGRELRQELKPPVGKLKPLNGELKPPCSPQIAGVLPPGSPSETGSESGEAAKKGETGAENAREGSETRVKTCRSSYAPPPSGAAAAAGAHEHAEARGAQAQARDEC